VVRLPDQSELKVSADVDEFETTLSDAFPECADRAITFYRECADVSNALLRAFDRSPDLLTAGKLEQVYSFLPHLFEAARISKMKDHTVQRHLHGTSSRFRRFVDAQLQCLALSPGETCSYLYATVALTLSRQQMFSIKGGAPAVVAALAESIKTSGGNVRLNATVLRLAYDSSGRALGVTLLTGETVKASRAIISNLTVWDTYGRLIGLDRTPTEIRKYLNVLRGWGTYVMYLGMDEAAAKRIPNNTLALTDWQEGQIFDPQEALFMFAPAPSWDTRGPAGKCAVTAVAFTDVDQWFTFHESEEHQDQLDQSMLESCWRHIHQAMPELGDGLEVIETATPSTLYRSTRRKFGMMGGVGIALAEFGPEAVGSNTSLNNVFMVGDTTFPGAGIAPLSFAALSLADRLLSQTHW
jgi:phytoene dehydrogenase-like protein